jgi:cytochrome d ubiquinol oxidase subunit I
MEAHFETQKGAPLFIGGIVDMQKREVTYKLEIPTALSFLAFGDFDAEVKGLNDFPMNEQPPVPIAHYAFQVMVGMGMILALAAVLYFVSIKKKSWQSKPKFWLLFALLSPVGYIALEAGWVVTEVGRQPWIIHKIMRTSDAVTPMPGMVYSFYFYVLLYTILSFTVIWLMRRQIKVLNSKTE